MIWPGSALLGGSRGVKDLGQLFGFLKQRFETFAGQECRTLGQLDPKAAFIRFFEYNRDLIDEVCIRLSPQCSPVVCSHRSATTSNLAADGLASRRLRQRIHHFQDSHCEIHGPFLEFVRGHRTAIPNHKS
jgi:hypothetical protein